MGIRLNRTDISPALDHVVRKRDDPARRYGLRLPVGLLLNRLGTRIVLVLAIAILPLMIISMTRSQNMISETDARTQAVLANETFRAAENEIVSIEQAKSVVQMLSHVVPLALSDTQSCSGWMRRVIIDTPFSFAAFVDASGNAQCSSDAQPLSFGITRDVIDQVKGAEPTAMVHDSAPSANAPILIASHPVFADTQSYIGFVVVSRPHNRLQRETVIDGSDITFLTAHNNGRVMTTSTEMNQAAQLMPLLSRREQLEDLPSTFSRSDSSGAKRLYAILPIVENQLFAVGVWQEPLHMQKRSFLNHPAFLPAMLWLASLAAAWFATSLFVTQHVVHLRQSMLTFANNRVLADASEFEKAPRELQEVASSFLSMSEAILKDEAQVENTLQQKDTLLQEVHHRVKNNLQLITSIMSMQMRQSHSQEVKGILGSLRDRVNSLATVHKGLYQTTGQVDVEIDDLLETIVRQVVRMGVAQQNSIDLKTELTPLKLNADQAVPLSLFVTEALTNALKYMGTNGEKRPQLSVLLTNNADQRATVTISNDVASDRSAPDADQSTGLGSELMEAFAMQLSGTLSWVGNDDIYSVVLSFLVDPLVAEI